MEGRDLDMMASLQGLTAALAPPLFAAIFEVFARPEASPRAPGAPFALSAVLALAALVIVALARDRSAGAVGTGPAPDPAAAG